MIGDVSNYLGRNKPDIEGEFDGKCKRGHPPTFSEMKPKYFIKEDASGIKYGYWEPVLVYCKCEGKINEQ